MPDGVHRTLSWILGFAEDAAVRPLYGLISAASSLHWMDWGGALPRFRDILAPRGVLAIIEERPLATSWGDPPREIVEQYSTNRRFQPFDLTVELEIRGLF